ncbi:unnamed protein product [Caenorhabditis auriculariae]|uniref:Uncharacterized protein n=1 Tax=Caenorhabditis auriculariae TaxID=2777116 RepID=A0A8S1HM15_9PELO|nr:unnamed protein product [Caenorhabditis auriculariae]
MTKLSLAVLLIVGLSTAVRADWWDSLTDSVSEGFVSAAGWVKDTASPAVRYKFNEYKEKLQDPETHKVVREWVSEKAAAASEFAQEEIVPELKKIYDAATADSQEKEKSKEE